MTRPQTPPIASASTPMELEVGGFEAFFTREYPKLVSLLTAMTGNRMVAEELAQEAMVRAHQRWDRIARYDIPGAWVRRVAINLATNNRARRRSEKRALTRLASERPTWEVDLGRDHGDDGDEFWATVRTLPRRQAAAVVLHYLEDRPVAEVAAILECAEGTAKAHLHKGRANLAKLLDQPLDEPLDQPLDHPKDTP